jgi:hypothetical protein
VGGSEIRFARRPKRPHAWVRIGNPWLQAAP